MTLRRRAFSLAVVFLILRCTGTFAWDWPVLDGEVVTVFGANGGKSLGIQIAGSAQDVLAAEAGEVIFAADGSDCLQCLPSVLGSFVVVHHERGFRTVYGHLAEIAETIGDSNAVSSGSRIGVLGQSGGALGMRLHFQVVDSRRGVVVNPLLLLPALQDQEPPVVRAIELEPVPDEPNRRRVVVSSVDEMGGRALLPYGFELLIDGQLQREVVLDTLRVDERSGDITTSDGYPIDAIVRSNGSVDLGVYPIVSGVTEIEIVIRDQNGNTTVRQLRPAALP